MSEAAALQTQTTKAPPSNSHSLLVQRKCACGGSSGLTGSCSGCEKKKLLGKPLQTKLRVNEPGDEYEQEADRIADQVISTPAHHMVSGTPPRIQRYTGQATGQAGSAPASVEHVLAGPGSPLEPALRQGMEQRFGYDFSRVRVHSGGAAEQSARDVNAHAYTVGHDIVFSAGQFDPGTHEGRWLIAHELTHFVQQTRNASFPTQRIVNAESGLEREAKAMGGTIASDRNSRPESLTPQLDAVSANIGSTPALLQRAPDEKRPGTELGGLNSPYPEEEAVLQHAIKALASDRFAQGVVFYFTNNWKAIGLSSSAFVVGPITSDMGPYFCVYRLKSLNKKKGTSTFSRGIYSGGWGGDKITSDLYETLARVEGRTELEVKDTGPTSADPRDSLAFMMTVWTARGLLDPARLPQGVAAIPPLPITQAQHKQLETNLSGYTAVVMIGGLHVVQSTGAAAQTAITGTSAGATATTFARGTGTFVAVTEEAAAGAALETGTSTAAGRAATAARVGTAIFAGLTVYFWDMSEAGKGSTLPSPSEITGLPHEGPGQREWEARLTPKQKDYFRDQWRLRYGPPGPVPIERLEPTPTPTKRTEPETQRRRRRRRCKRATGPSCPSWQPRLIKPNTYWNHAYVYRRDKQMLSREDFNQNVAVLLLDGEEPIVQKNDMGFHSEQEIIWTLTKRGIDSGCPILGLFSERKPCQQICQKQVLPQLCRVNDRVPFGVFFAIDYYNSPGGMKSENNRHELIKSYLNAGYKL